MDRQENINFEEDALLENICDILEIKQMKVTISSSFKSGVIVGATTTVGGLCLGRQGLPLGAAVGLATSLLIMRKNFKSVPDIIMNNLTSAQRKALYIDLVRLLSSRKIICLEILLARLSAGDPSLIKDIGNIIRKFIKKQYLFRGAYI
ncbi:hypothetical protein PV328_005490 [Microctonus aethiopoides]|uniref:Uncharacterized protein n=1 Tax=Microctonus aethiopoides TaxID=144406 RepID=A0AA39KSI6_9HYME|nr:hypothetical protein PV328_005490 [Microctonus aethiopoides]